MKEIYTDPEAVLKARAVLENQTLDDWVVQPETEVDGVAVDYRYINVPDMPQLHQPDQGTGLGIIDVFSLAFHGQRAARETVGTIAQNGLARIERRLLRATSPSEPLQEPITPIPRTRGAAARR
jgi:hypothetical protein